MPLAAAASAVLGTWNLDGTTGRATSLPPVLLRTCAVAAAALVFAAPAHAGAPPVSARAFLIQDAATGEVLAQHASWARLPIASITKLMTVLVALEHAELDDVVSVRSEAAAVGESTINLRTGERIRVRDLVEAALIQSANDAADALAEYVGRGSTARFVALMNAKGRELGLTRTRFTRPDGLDAPGHVSSARDVTRLAEVVMRLSAVRSIVRRRTATISGGRVLHTWNDLLGVFPGLVGVKTGHTAGAGWCEVGAARRFGVTLYVTVLGSPTRSQRNADLAALLRWGLSRYRRVWIVQPGRVYLRAQVAYGRAPVPLVPARTVARPVRIDRPLVERVVAPSALALPVRRGSRVGEVCVYSGRRVVARVPLLAGRSVSRPGLGGRVGFYAGRTFSHLGDWFT
jgi:serine-type D-Ala-D-Ala carboxypeptidase (penicillin-binding protein 5/6)